MRWDAKLGAFDRAPLCDDGAPVIITTLLSPIKRRVETTTFCSPACDESSERSVRFNRSQPRQCLHLHTYTDVMHMHAFMMGKDV